VIQSDEVLSEGDALERDPAATGSRRQAKVVNGDPGCGVRLDPRAEAITYVDEANNSMSTLRLRYRGVSPAAKQGSLDRGLSRPGLPDVLDSGRSSRWCSGGCLRVFHLGFTQVRVQRSALPFRVMRNCSFVLSVLHYSILVGRRRCGSVGLVLLITTGLDNYFVFGLSDRRRGGW